MKSNFETVNLSRCETVFEIPAECSFETSVNMPDYCPEIKKILKSNVTVNYITLQNNSNKITVQADVIVRIAYVGDNGEIAGYEQIEKIEKSVDASVPDDCFVNANIFTDYINTRAVNQRKVEVRAMMSVKFKAIRKRNESVLTSVDGCGIQSDMKNCVFANLTGLAEKTFSLTETVELDKSKGAVKRVLNASSYVCISEIKVINNKALIKGNSQVVVHYICESSNSVEYVEFSLPISQIAEAEGINETSLIDLNMNVCSCEVAPRVDSSGEMRLFDLNLKISALLKGYEEKKISFINDCYSTEREIKTVSKKFELLEHNDIIDTTMLNKVVLESIGVSLNNVLGVWCSEFKYSFGLSGDKCVLSGTYQATVLYLDSDNQIGVIQKPVEFENLMNIKKSAERVAVSGNAQIVGCSCAVTGDSRVELKSEIAIKCMVFSVRNIDYVSDVVLDENSEFKHEPCALTIYFCDGGESVWSIAKKYNTTVKAIQEENSFDDEIINGSQMLLIPAT